MTVPGAVRSGNTGTTAGQNTVIGSGSGVSNRRSGTAGSNNRPYNPYVPQRYREGNNGYGVVYGYPYYPFSYGFNGGWYGGYGSRYGYSGYSYNNNYPFNLPYGNYSTGNNDNDSGTAQQVPSPAVNTPVTGNDQAVPSGGSVTMTNGSAATQARATNAVDQSPAMVAANNSVALAQSNFDSARERALAALSQKPDYKDAVARRHDAAKDVHAAATGAGGTPTPAVTEAATVKLEAGDEVTKMEEQAVATDPTASAAKARLDQAVADRNSLRSQLMAQVQQGSK